MQVMGLCCSWCSKCFRICFGDKNSESNYLFPSTPFVQPVKTVRRISSVGQTLTNEDGEEIEMPRHSNILKSYNGVPIPCSQSAITVQPGVSKIDLENRLKTLPTISEVPIISKSKKPASWKLPIPSKQKKEYALSKQREKSSLGEIQLKRFIRKTNSEDSSSTTFPRLNQLNVKEKQQSNLRRGSCTSSPNLVTFEQSSEKYSSSNYTLDSLTNVSLRTNLAKSTTWLHSQSLEEVKDKEQEAERLARQYGLDLSLYKNIDVRDSPDVRMLDLENPCDLFVEESGGFVEFSLYINSSQNMLSIFVGKVGGLSGIGADKLPFSVMLKVCVLSHKNMVKTSKKMALNLNPIVNQSFTFYVKAKDNRVIRVSVFNSDFLGRYDAIGHALISPQDFECNKNFRAKLFKKSVVGVSTGMVQISCHIFDDKFNVTVIKAFNLLPKFRNQKIYIKISYYSLSRKCKEKVSSIVTYSGTEIIEFNHEANFRIDTSGRKHNYFVISLKKKDEHSVFKHDETIGRVFIGPCFYFEDGKLTPWGHVILNREQLCHTYKLYL